MGFYQVCLELNSHWVFHIAGSIFSSPHPVCLSTCWGVGSRGCPTFGVGINFGKATDLLPKFSFTYLDLENWRMLPSPKKKHSTVAGGLFKKDNLFVTPTQIFRQWPTWNLGRFSVSAFFCASTDLRWATRSFHRSATPHVPDPSSSEQGQRPPIHQWNTQATHPGPLMKGNKRRWMKSLEGWELSLNFFQPATKRRWMWKQLRKILPKAGS